MRRYEDFFLALVASVIGLGIVACFAFIVYAGGWSVGLWPMSCKFASSQPACVKAGWGHHNDVTIRGTDR